LSSLPVIVIGFLLGMLHATDADHVIAVSTIVSRQGNVRSAAAIGVLWGIGHTLTVFVVGGAIILFSLAIPPRLGLAMEFGVALMLILLGLLTLRGVSMWVRQNLFPAPDGSFPGHSHVALAASAHLHTHAHGDYVHIHVHGHSTDDHGHAAESTPQAWLDRKLSGLSAYQKMRPLIIGVVHGMAGSAAVALLILAQIREPLWGVVYLLLFGLGTIAGMMLITSVIALPFAYSVRRFPHLNIWMRLSAGVLSLGFGLYLAYHIGFVNGLFTPNPHWTPG
jgi:ABC-type transport system involved in multi-copper enzyme maturation permease subunit